MLWTLPEGRVPDMRVAFYGNLCNNLYQICRGLRQFTHIDAHLFIDGGLGDLQQLPENDDSALLAGYPDWIHRIPSLSQVELLLTPWRAPLLKHLGGFDALVVSGYGPMVAQFGRVPTFFLTAGGDLTQWPFPLRFRRLYARWYQRVGQLFRAFWQRRGIQRCAEVWTQPFAPFRLAIQRLSLEPGRVSVNYFPLILDTAKFKPRPLSTLSGQARQLRSDFDFVVFHPSRMLILDDIERQETGDWKANDRLLLGFARFVKDNPGLRAGLALVDRPASRDAPLAREMIRRLQIENSVVWLKPERPFGFTREQLIELYSASDVVADDFGAGWFGSVVVEALSIGVAVVSYLDESAMAQIYPWHPVVNACQPEEIASALQRLWDQPGWRQEQAQQGQRWVEEFHSYQGAGRIYADRFRELALRMNKVSQPELKTE
jgi:glycosyltransferase involved in cell wall biosynthesis